MTQRSEDPDTGERSCRPFLGRSRFDGVLNGCCTTEQDRSPPTFAVAQSEGLRLRQVDCPLVGGPGGQARMATDSGKHRGNWNKQACGQRVLIATE